MSYTVGILVVFLIIYTLVITKYLNKLFKIQPTNFKYNSIEGLRGFLALFVFIHHFVIWYTYIKAGSWEEPQSNLFNHLGKSGVSFFFMITGFLFTNKLLENSEINWKHFFVNRVIRLVPLYFFSILLIIFIAFGLSHFKLYQPLSEFTYNSLQWFLFTYIGSPDINLLKDSYTLNAGVTWTLAHEWFFYFAFPIIAFVFFRKRTPFVYLAICLSFLLIFIFKGEPLYFYMLYFIVGGLTSAILLHYKKIAFINLNSIYASLVIIALSIINVCFFHSPENLLCLLLNFVIFIIIAGGNSFFNILLHKNSQVLGQLSYGMYILHGIVIYIFNSIVMKNEFIKSLSFIDYFFLSFLYITALMLFSFLTNKFIERPFSKFKKAVR